jgi:AAA domain
MSSHAKVRQRLAKALTAAPYFLHTPLPDTFVGIGASDRGLHLANACLGISPQIRVADELDLHPDLLIVDYDLGAIGLVHIVQASASEPLDEQCKRHVDQATYLRHLLVTRGVLAETVALPLDYTVECVLVVERDQARVLTKVVREIASKTYFLRATGLHFLTFTPPAAIDQDELRRAFAWLLAATKQRMAECASPGVGNRLGRLELFNYRLPGLRSWQLSDARVHLLHGANGTGKSSIAEALELAVTGAVERIKTSPQPDHAAVIRNSEATGAAAITLAFRDGSQRQFDVVAGGVADSALRPDLPVTAFRLDQAVMEQLIRSDSQQRARVLTQAFFPSQQYQLLEQAQQRFNMAYRELPLELRREVEAQSPAQNDRPAVLMHRLAWVEASSVPAERIADCFPLQQGQLEVLGRIVPEIFEALRRLENRMDRRDLEAVLATLEEALGRIRSSVRLYDDALVQSLAVLRRLASWAPTPEEVRFDYSDLLRRWSDRLAMSDLLTKHLEVAKTIGDARAAGWEPRNLERVGLFAASTEVLVRDRDSLLLAAKVLAQEQDGLFRQLRSTSNVPSASVEQRSLTTTLSTSEIDYLNLTCAWFGRQEATPPAGLFGDMVQEAVTENKSTVFGSITIGGREWTRRPIEFLEPLVAALDELLAFEPMPGPSAPSDGASAASEPAIYRSPLVRLHAYQAALDAARQVTSAANQVEAALLKRVAEQKLNEALDEVITLFTPARWAYEGLLLAAALRDGKVEMDLTTSRTKSRAELRFNTAELNLMVLALYFLCGPTIANPLGTIVFDDPLQNMDELTAATVARGVAKIAALLPEGWQLILMFHGEEDLATFCREVRGAVYRLPWLGPTAAPSPDGEGVRLEAHPREPPTAKQSLDQVMRRRVPMR